MESGLFGLPVTLWYPTFAAIMFLITWTFVPRERVKCFFPYSIVFGVIPSWLFVLILQALGVFQYHHYGPFSLLGVPFLLCLAWSVAVIIFLHFLPPLKSGPLFHWGYITGISLIGAMVESMSSHIGIHEFIHWSSLARFITGFIWFTLIAAYYRKYGIE